MTFEIKMILENIKLATKVFRLFIQAVEFYAADVKDLPQQCGSAVEVALLKAMQGDLGDVKKIPTLELQKMRNAKQNLRTQTQGESNIIKHELDERAHQKKLELMQPQQLVAAEEAHSRMMAESRTQGSKIN